MNEPAWVTPDDVIELNRLAVEVTGEPHLLRSRDLLESACERPKTYWHYDRVDDVVRLGATLLFGIARNHPFAQGNKRTAFASFVGFLNLNGFDLEIEDSIENADLIVAVIEKQVSEDDLIETIRPFVVPLRST